MSWKLVGQGGVLDAYDILKYEETVDEDKKVMLEVDLRYPLSDATVNAIRSQLQFLGVPDLKVSAGSPLRVEWRKGFAWALLIVGIIAALVLATIIVGWKFFKEVIEVIPPAVITTGVIVAIIAVVIAVITVIGAVRVKV